MNGWGNAVTKLFSSLCGTHILFELEVNLPVNLWYFHQRDTCHEEKHRQVNHQHRKSSRNPMTCFCSPFIIPFHIIQIIYSTSQLLTCTLKMSSVKSILKVYCMVEYTVFSNVNSRTCVSFKMLYTGQTHNQTDNKVKVTTNEQKMKSKVTTYLICVCLFKWNYCIISSLSYSSQQHGRIGSDASIHKQDKTECKLRQ